MYPTYWEKLVDGRQFRDTWEDNVEYYQGDIVTWQGTSYVCLTYRSIESLKIHLTQNKPRERLLEDNDLRYTNKQTSKTRRFENF